MLKTFGGLFGNPFSLTYSSRKNDLDLMDYYLK